MKNIRDFKVTQIRLFRSDEIPFRSLFGPSAENRLRSEFRLKRLPVPPGLGIPGMTNLVFVNGEYATGRRTVFIDHLAIEERRVVVTVTGSSEDCDSVFSHLRGVLKQIDFRNPPPEYRPLLVVQESACVVELDASLTKLFSNSPIERIMDSVSSAVDSYGCSVNLFPSSVHVRVKYESPPAELATNHIALVEKDIVIELRAGTSIEENTYFISSPMSSDNHLKLIRAVEEAFR